MTSENYTPVDLVDLTLLREVWGGQNSGIFLSEQDELMSPKTRNHLFRRSNISRVAGAIAEQRV